MKDYLNKFFEIDEEIEINKNSERESSEEKRIEEYKKYIKLRQDGEIEKDSERRNHIVALFLALLFGIFGIHQFYLGKKGQGLLKLAGFTLGIIFSIVGYNHYILFSDPTLITVGIVLDIVAVSWWIYDLCMISYNKMLDINNRILKGESHRNDIFLAYLTIFFGIFGMHTLYLNKTKVTIMKFVSAITLISIIFIGIYLKSINSLGESEIGDSLIISGILSGSFLIIWWVIDIYLILNKEYESDKYAIIEDGIKSQSVAILFSVFGGIFGLDRFYLGYRTLGILKMFTIGGFGISAILDFILIYLNVLKDSDGNEMELE